MINFYILAFLGFASIIAAIFFACVLNPTWETIRTLTLAMIMIGVTVFIVALHGVTKHSGYAHFDPTVCAQMVYDEDSRKWVCVTWEEAR